MPKKFVLVLLLLVIAITPSTAFSQSDDSVNALEKDSANSRQEAVRAQRAQFKALIDEKREQHKSQIQARKQEFRSKIQEIRDQAKQDRILRIDTALEALNKKAITRLTNGINKLETILGRLVEKAETIKEEGQDTTDLESAITDAQIAIAEAKTAITEQAERQYIIELNDEETHKASVGEVVSTLRADIKETFDVAKIAKEKVQDVARQIAILKQSKNINLEDNQNATGSGIETDQSINDQN